MRPVTACNMCAASTNAQRAKHPTGHSAACANTNAARKHPACGVDTAQRAPKQPRSMCNDAVQH
eukprot:7133909-Alexandrium_andersonii.AAC.1